MSRPTARTLARIESVAVLRRKNYTSRQIAQRLGVTVRTVDRYASLAKLRAAQSDATSAVASWESRAACKGVSPSLFFLDWYQARNPQVKAAKAICRGCPVLARCQAFVDAHPWWTSDGIWAATTPSERRRARRVQAERTAA